MDTYASLGVLYKERNVLPALSRNFTFSSSYIIPNYPDDFIDARMCTSDVLAHIAGALVKYMFLIIKKKS